jgi:hypothetical protein
MAGTGFHSVVANRTPMVRFAMAIRYQILLLTMETRGMIIFFVAIRGLNILRYAMNRYSHLSTVCHNKVKSNISQFIPLLTA